MCSPKPCDPDAAASPMSPMQLTVCRTVLLVVAGAFVFAGCIVWLYCMAVLRSMFTRAGKLALPTITGKLGETATAYNRIVGAGTTKVFVPNILVRSDGAAEVLLLD